MSVKLITQRNLSEENYIKLLRKEFGILHSALQTETSFIDFGHLHSLFLGQNDKVLKHKRTIQQKKFNNL